MTAIFYPDCRTTSANGRFVLEARSPHNGSIPHRDGHPVSEDEFPFYYKSHQSHFRYRLIDATAPADGAGSKVVWERWQRKGEDSPHELLVSDEGWSILRLHGFRPEVVVVSPTGRAVLRVRIEFSPSKSEAAAEPEPSDNDDDDDLDDDGPPHRQRVSWVATGMHWTTGGAYWSINSWPSFFHHGGASFFAWRTSWGDRLIVDLDAAALVNDVSKGSPLFHAADEAEQRGACTLLERLTPRLDEIQQLLTAAANAGDDDDEDDDAEDAQRQLFIAELRDATSAIHLIGVHGLRERVPLLRAWEPLGSEGSLSSTFALGSGWWLRRESFRPIVQHALRVLGAVPQPYPAFGFKYMDEPSMDLPASGPDRTLDSGSLGIGMPALEVLRALGAPDFVSNESHQHGDVYHWTEHWEYDFLLDGGWKTLRITFEEGEPQGHVIRIHRGDAEWLHDRKREEAILYL